MEEERNSRRGERERWKRRDKKGEIMWERRGTGGGGEVKGERGEIIYNGEKER